MHRIYTDGSCFKNKRGEPCAWAYVCTACSATNSGVIAEGSNNVAEMAAILAAVTHIQKKHRDNIVVCSDSELCINWLAGKWQIKNADIGAMARAVHTTRNERDLLLCKVRGHSGEPGNELADKIAKETLKQWFSSRSTNTTRRAS